MRVVVVVVVEEEEVEEEEILRLSLHALHCDFGTHLIFSLALSPRSLSLALFRARALSLYVCRDG